MPFSTDTQRRDQIFELRVPPVIVLLFTALVMWLISRFVPAAALVLPARVIFAVSVAVIGASISVAGLVAFARAGTSVNPLNPQASSVLVLSGVYGLTRNPMYLGFLMILAGWAILLSNAVGFLLLPAFLIYMNRFQIAPEERALTARFGHGFEAYKSRARRWL